MSTMTKDQYLDKLRWDKSQYEVMTSEECSGLKDKPGAVNHMYKISEPSGKEAFGKDAFVVNIKFAQKFLSEEAVDVEVMEPETVEVQAPTNNIPPPPPVKTFSAPTAPVEPRNKEGLNAQELLDKEEPFVPEKIKEIAKASPNVIIATMPKREEEEPQWPSHVLTRMENLIGTGSWKNIGGDILRNTSGKTVHFQDLDDMENKEYTALLIESKKTESELPSAEQLKAAQDKAEKDRAEVLHKKGLERIAILVKNGCTEHLDDDKNVIGIDAWEGEALGIDRISKMDNKEWMETTVKYNPKAVRDGKAAVKAEKPKADEVEVDHSLARRQALYALGWKDDPKYAKYMTDPIGKGITHDDILDMSEADFKKLLSVPVKDVPVVTKEMEETAAKNAKIAETEEWMDKQEAEQKEADRLLSVAEAEVMQKKADEKKADAKAIAETHAEGEKAAILQTKQLEAERELRYSRQAEKKSEAVAEGNAKVFDKEKLQEQLEAVKSRDEIAFAVMLKLVSPTSKKGADTIAKFAYELADSMLTQKLK